jgi:hypothetical protein
MILSGIYIINSISDMCTFLPRRGARETGIQQYYSINSRKKQDGHNKFSREIADLSAESQASRGSEPVL